jgi:hypothetical protein
VLGKETEKITRRFDCVNSNSVSDNFSHAEQWGNKSLWMDCECKVLPGTEIV